MSKEQGSESAVSGSQSIKEEEMEEEKEAPRKLSRRDFVKGAAVGGAGVAAAGVLASCAPPATPAPGETAAPAPTCPPAAECPLAETPWLPAKWDYEADVVVVGYGGAGVAAAIAAYDAGVKVLMLEKMPKELAGGNACVCGGSIFCTRGPDETEYLRALGQGTADEDMIGTMAEAMYENFDWFKGLGNELAEKTSANDYPDFPGSDRANRFEIEYEGAVNGAAMMAFLMGQVDNRGIEVMYETPGKELVQNPVTRDIIGVKAESGGQEIFIKAKRGVVLTTGGFEFNKELLSNHWLPNFPVFGAGTPGNTGDGIKMAQAVGAELWHMPIMSAGSASVGGLVIPGYQAAGSVSPDANSYIFVASYGERFINEKRAGHHGQGHSQQIVYDDERLSYPGTPGYLIFDETTKLAGRLGPAATSGWLGLKEGFEWSEDNNAEIEKGWIIKADTIQELAGKLEIDPDTLEESVNTYNGYCVAGVDADFNRPAEEMDAIETPPYYAIEIWPRFLNTQGGPKRNKDAQVIHADGEPIPRLYSAGELGSFFSFLYNGGCNISGDCFGFGRIAARNAAALEPWG